jgi:hypothetical protein
VRWLISLRTDPLFDERDWAFNAVLGDLERAGIAVPTNGHHDDGRCFAEVELEAPCASVAMKRITAALDRLSGIPPISARNPRIRIYREGGDAWGIDLGESRPTDKL